MLRRGLIEIRDRRRRLRIDAALRIHPAAATVQVRRTKPPLRCLRYGNRSRSHPLRCRRISSISCLRRIRYVALRSGRLRNRRTRRCLHHAERFRRASRRLNRLRKPRRLHSQSAGWVRCRSK